MTLGDLADIADLLAAIGVIASLIYVGYQVRETRTAVRAATAQARTDLGVQLISSRYTSDISDVLVKSEDTLSEADKFKLKSFFSAHVRHCQNLFYQQQHGLLDEYFSYGVSRTVAYWIRNYPWAASEWRNARKTMPADFAHFIDTELEHHPETFDA